MWKRGEIASKEQFLPLFHIILYIFLTSGVKLHIHLLNVVVQFIVFLTLSTLICRGTDTCISKCFSESLGIRDNESRLYLDLHCSLYAVYWAQRLCIKYIDTDQTAASVQSDPSLHILYIVFNGIPNIWSHFFRVNCSFRWNAHKEHTLCSSTSLIL